MIKFFRDALGCCLEPAEDDGALHTEISGVGFAREDLFGAFAKDLDVVPHKRTVSEIRSLLLGMLPYVPAFFPNPTAFTHNCEQLAAALDVLVQERMPHLSSSQRPAVILGCLPTLEARESQEFVGEVQRLLAEVVRAREIDRTGQGITIFVSQLFASDDAEPLPTTNVKMRNDGYTLLFQMKTWIAADVDRSGAISTGHMGKFFNFLNAGFSKLGRQRTLLLFDDSGNGALEWCEYIALYQMLTTLMPLREIFLTLLGNDDEEEFDSIFNNNKNNATSGVSLNGRKMSLSSSYATTSNINLLNNNNNGAANSSSSLRKRQQSATSFSARKNTNTSFAFGRQMSSIGQFFGNNNNNNRHNATAAVFGSEDVDQPQFSVMGSSRFRHRNALKSAIGGGSGSATRFSSSLSQNKKSKKGKSNGNSNGGSDDDDDEDDGNNNNSNSNNMSDRNDAANMELLLGMTANSSSDSKIQQRHREEALVSRESLKKFLKEKQHETNDSQIRNIFDMMGPACPPPSMGYGNASAASLDRLSRSEGYTFFQIQLYLTSHVSNCWRDHQDLAFHQSMSQPLCHYFINSSHNTYLDGKQFIDTASYDMYELTLREGCRCVEIDCWNGRDGEPIVTHGHAGILNPLTFRGVIEVINRSAFLTSPYPVILSLEVHTDDAQQTKMAHIMEEIFGDRLVKAAVADRITSLFDPQYTPDALKHKILAKNKYRAPPKTYPASNNNEHKDDNQNNENNNTGNKKSGRGNFLPGAQLMINASFTKINNKLGDIVFGAKKQNQNNNNNNNNNSPTSSSLVNNDDENVLATAPKNNSNSKRKQTIEDYFGESTTSSDFRFLDDEEEEEEEQDAWYREFDNDAHLKFNNNNNNTVGTNKKFEFGNVKLSDERAKKKSKKNQDDDDGNDDYAEESPDSLTASKRKKVAFSNVTNRTNNDEENQENEESGGDDDDDQDDEEDDQENKNINNDSTTKTKTKLQKQLALLARLKELGGEDNDDDNEVDDDDDEGAQESDAAIDDPHLFLSSGLVASILKNKNGKSALDEKQKKILKKERRKLEKLLLNKKEQSSNSKNRNDNDQSGNDLEMSLLSGSNAVPNSGPSTLDPKLLSEQNVSPPSSTSNKDSSTKNVSSLPSIKSEAGNNNTNNNNNGKKKKNSSKEDSSKNGIKNDKKNSTSTVAGTPPTSTKSSGGGGGGGGGHRVALALAAVTFIRATVFKVEMLAGSGTKNFPVFGVSSKSEEVPAKWITKDAEILNRLRELSTRFHYRIYPAFFRTDSSNYDPLPGWLVGGQMVALNFQTNDQPVRVNRERFRTNGNCGYVLKPALLRGGVDALRRSNVISDFYGRTTLSIKVMCGLLLPRPPSLPDKTAMLPVVVVILHGTYDDTAAVALVQNNNNNNNNNLTDPDGTGTSRFDAYSTTNTAHGSMMMMNNNNNNNNSINTNNSFSKNNTYPPSSPAAPIPLVQQQTFKRRVSVTELWQWTETSDNGLAPTFDTTFTFVSTSPQVALVSVYVYHTSDFIESNFAGGSTCPLLSLQRGIRAVPIVPARSMNDPLGRFEPMPPPTCVLVDIDVSHEPMKLARGAIAVDEKDLR